MGHTSKSVIKKIKLIDKLLNLIWKLLGMIILTAIVIVIITVPKEK